MRRALFVIAVCAATMTAVVPAAVSGAAGEGADLSVVMTWAGRGAAHGKVGDVVTYTVSVENHGPDVATDVRVWMGMGDQFNPEGAQCGSGTATSTTECTFPTVAANTSVEVHFSARVCCFPKGEVRDAGVSAHAESAVADPDPTNNDAQVPTRIIGRNGFFPPSVN